MLLSLAISVFLFFQQRTMEPIASEPTGLEWMVAATILVPAALLIVIVYFGSRSTV